MTSRDRPTAMPSSDISLRFQVFPSQGRLLLHAKMDFLLMFCYTLVIILIQLMFLILKLMLSLDSAIYFENYKSKLSGEMEPTTIMIIAFLSMLLLAIIVIQCLEAAAAQEHRLFSDAIDYNNNARNLAQIV
ncbi:hypothetical protein QR680_015285 [Steinernema hermaphroditum]|uniref:Uncharacterized protein n=1 Tax=Steinernema hermaphroditum TaxID=289476 RepID=A0AA39LKG0_9BILA|nr:hypothetical protein QR680_015285 [Steinernema hermaphroditum]